MFLHMPWLALSRTFLTTQSCRSCFGFLKACIIIEPFLSCLSPLSSYIHWNPEVETFVTRIAYFILQIHALVLQVLLFYNLHVRKCFIFEDLTLLQNQTKRLLSCNLVYNSLTFASEGLTLFLCLTFFCAVHTAWKIVGLHEIENKTHAALKYCGDNAFILTFYCPSPHAN